MVFLLTEVVKTKENFFFIEWDMTPTVPESVDDWEFEIHWSFDPVSGFLSVLDSGSNPIVIDGAVGPLTYTHQVRQYDFNKDRYYKVLAREKAVPANEFFSDTVFIGMYTDGMHETIKHAEDTLHTMYHGEPCLIIKRKAFGARCPTCWSQTRRQRVRTHCDTCNGTGYVTGYYQPLSIQMSFDSDPKKTDSQKEWENVFDTKRARMTNYPLVRPKDLIVNQDDNKRYVITHVETTKLPKLSESAIVLSKQNYILSQLLTLEELNPDDNEYFIDVDNIPEVPLGDEGNTGSTLPFFNDHMPVTVDAPLVITDEQQHVELNISNDDFVIEGGELKLKYSTGAMGIDTFTSAEIISTTLKVCALNNAGELIVADYSNIDHLNRVVGISLNVASIGTEVMVQKMGVLSNLSWSWNIGTSIFFDGAGNLTQVPQATGIGFFMIVAKPLSTTSIDVLLRSPVIRSM